MSPNEAINRLEDMQKQIIHGKPTFKEIADIIRVAQKFANSVRDFHCGHKPFGVGGKCEACEALKEWDAL